MKVKRYDWHENGHEPSDIGGWVSYSDYETLEAQLAECYRLTGSDPDGDSNPHLAQHAVQAVKELREEADKAGEWEERAIAAEEVVERLENDVIEMSEALGG